MQIGTSAWRRYWWYDVVAGSERLSPITWIGTVNLKPGGSFSVDCCRGCLSFPREWQSRLNFAGKHPVESGALNNSAMNGANNLLCYLTNHVGATSSWQLLFGALPISFTTASGVTSSHSFSACLAVTATSGSAVEDVDWRTASTLLAKKVANSSAVWPLELLVFFVSPIVPDRVRHSFLLSPLLSSILVRQYNLFCSYSRRSDFDCVNTVAATTSCQRLDLFFGIVAQPPSLVDGKHGIQRQTTVSVSTASAS